VPVLLTARPLPARFLGVFLFLGRDLGFGHFLALAALEHLFHVLHVVIVEILLEVGKMVFLFLVDMMAVLVVEILELGQPPTFGHIGSG